MRWQTTLAASLAAHVAVVVRLMTPAVPAELPRQTAPSGELVGETFDLPTPDVFEAIRPQELATVDVTRTSSQRLSTLLGSPPQDSTAPSDQPPSAVAPQRPSRRATGRADGPGRVEATSAAAMYGAVGERSAIELVRAFTRGFPQAASGDPAWRTVAFGPAGDATVVLTLDESGHLVDTQILGAATSALEQGIRRTFSILGSRPFVARRKVTKLHLSARVIPNSVPDGLHGDVFAIGAGDDSAFFALRGGRRIELRVGTP